MAASHYCVRFLAHAYWKRHTTYTVVVTSPSLERWTLWLRYSEIRDVHDALKVTFEDVQMPTIPGKRILRNFSPAFVAKRQAGLELYLNSVLRSVDPGVCHPKLRLLLGMNALYVPPRNNDFAHVLQERSDRGRGRAVRKDAAMSRVSRNTDEERSATRGRGLRLVTTASEHPQRCASRARRTARPVELRRGVRYTDPWQIEAALAQEHRARRVELRRDDLYTWSPWQMQEVGYYQLQVFAYVLLSSFRDDAKRVEDLFFANGCALQRPLVMYVGFDLDLVRQVLRNTMETLKVPIDWSNSDVEARVIRLWKKFEPEMRTALYKKAAQLRELYSYQTHAFDTFSEASTDVEENPFVEESDDDDDLDWQENPFVEESDDDDDLGWQAGLFVPMPWREGCTNMEATGEEVEEVEDDEMFSLLGMEV
eukprot:TRINITY_DN8926_c0_g1_i1.p1 TRINITY_DN8926_c0_g1~~TRINITY_DN8926_c0_g1_i1.p1  ORF type:complete len:424 (-),score=61.78 TRINITY_DN8926_c0_g1_i1:60-1331(-)